MSSDDSQSYEIVKTKNEKYVNYKVYVRAHEETWFVIRRYREFRALYDILKKAYPEAKLKIPPKRIIGNFSKSTIQERVEGLNNLVSQIIQTSGAMAEDCAVEFFRINDARNQPIPASERPEHSDDELGDGQDEMLLGPTYEKRMTPKNFDFRKVIGKGSFGRVYLAEHLESGQIYAVKVS